MTSTLVALAFESRLGKNRSQRWFRRVAAVVALGLGACAGALLLRWGIAWGIGLATLVVATVAVIGAIGRAEGVPDIP